MAGSERTPAGVKLSAKFDQPAGAGTWADAGPEGSPEALKVLSEQGVDAWRAWVRKHAAQSRASQAQDVSDELARARPMFDDEIAALRADFDEIGARAGDLDGSKLREYWTKGAGLAKWVSSPTPWRTLRGFLAKYLSGDKLDATTSSWYRIVFGALPMDR